MADELKPCPFCGGAAELDREQAYRVMKSGHISERAAVYCTRCTADMGFCYADGPGTPREDIVNEMVDSWNRRTPNRSELAQRTPVPTHECEFRIGQAVHLANPYPEDDPSRVYRVTAISWEYRMVAHRGWNITIATDDDIAKGYGQTDGFAPLDLRAALAKEPR